MKLRASFERADLDIQMSDRQGEVLSRKVDLRTLQTQIGGVVDAASTGRSGAAAGKIIWMTPGFFYPGAKAPFHIGYHVTTPLIYLVVDVNDD